MLSSSLYFSLLALEARAFSMPGLSSPHNGWATGYGDNFYPRPYMSTPRMRMPWMHEHPWASPAEHFSSMQPYGGYGGLPTDFRAPFDDPWRRSSAFEWEREFEAKIAEVLDQNQELAMRLEASQQPHGNDVEARLSEILERNKEMEAYLESMQERPHPSGEESGSPPMPSPDEMDGLNEAESNLADALNHNDELMKQLHGTDHPFSTSDTFSMLERNRELIEQLQAMREHRPMRNNFRGHRYGSPHAAAWGQMNPYDGYANSLALPTPELAFEDGYRSGFNDGFQNGAAQVELSLPMAHHQAWEQPEPFLDGFNGHAMGQDNWLPSREFDSGFNGFNNNISPSPRGFGSSSPLSHHGFDNGANREYSNSWNDRPYDEDHQYQRQGQRDNNRFPQQQRFNQQQPYFDSPMANQQPFVDRPKARFEQSGSDPFFQEVSQRRKSRLKDHFY